MNLLPNNMLAGFLKKRLFAEQRFIFVDQKDEDQINQNLEQQPVDLEVNEAGFFEKQEKQKLQKIGLDTRDQIWEVDQNGYFGMGGTRSTEKISENYSDSLEDLLLEKSDYDEAMNGVELKAGDFENSLGYELLGGTDGLPVKTFPGIFGKKVSEKYEALLEIREGLNYQERSAFAMDHFIQKYRDEIAEERAEYLINLEQERRNILEKIAEKVESEKQELDQQVQSFKNICAEPEALKVELTGERHLDEEQKTGLFDYVEKTTNFTELLEKIREGNFVDIDVEEMSEQIKSMQRLVEEKRQNIEDLKNLHEDPEVREETVSELLKGVQGILAEYREEGSKSLDSSKALTNAAEKKIVMQLISFQERLKEDDPKKKINIREIVFVEDVFGKFSQTLKVLRENRSVLEIEIPENKTSQEMKEEIQAEINQLLYAPVPLNSEARKSYRKNKADVQMLQPELSEANFKNFLFAEGQLDQNGKITGDEEKLRKQWLAGKQNALNVLKKRQQEFLNSPQEGLSNFTAKAEIKQYLKQIETAENPLKIVEQFLQEKHLKIVGEKEFDAAYRKTGITNSYLVIEQEEYNPELPDYRGNDWTIYLDEKYYDKIKNGEGNSDRFKARIAHELAHREFEIEVGNLLEKVGIYENENWITLKQKFTKIIQGKTIGGDKEGYLSDRNILNEMYALSRENAVQAIENNDLKEVVDDFTAVIFPFLDKKKKKLFGSMAETGKDDKAEEIEQTESSAGEGSETEKTEERSDLPIEESSTQKGAESEETEKARQNAVSNFKDFKNYIELFGGETENVEEKEDQEKKEEFKMDISRVENGEKLLDIAAKEYARMKDSIDNIESLRPNSVNDLNEWLGTMNSHFKTAEEEISSNDAGGPGYFENLWTNTRFLAFDDIYHLVTESWEFSQRRRDRRSQDARAAVGQKLFEGVPYLDLLANEYLSKQEKLEQDEVSEYQGNISNMSHEGIYPLLFNPKNVDHLKAVINDLCDKGRMRWDDHRVWKSLGKYTFVQIPNLKKADEDVVYRNEWLKKMVADVWDEDTWDGWRKANDGGLSSALNDLDSEADDIHALGSAPIIAKFNEILEASKDNIDDFKFGKGDGAIIPSHRYQKYLDYAFERGKLSMEAKFYYLIAGVAHRVIPIESLKKIQTDRFRALPILDYFYAARNTQNEVEELYAEMQRNGGFPHGAHKLLMHKVLHDGMTLTRVEKVLTSGPDKVDHDDWQALMAVASKKNIDKLLRTPNGAKAPISQLSMVNGMTSYSTFAKAQKVLMDEQGDKYNYAHFVDSLVSFVGYDARLMGRYGRVGQYERFDSTVLEQDPQGNGLKIKDYQQSMYDLIGTIFDEYYPNGEGKAYTDIIFTNTTGKTQEQVDKLRKDGMESKVDEFESRIHKILQDQRGIEIIRNALAQNAPDMADYSSRGRKFDYALNSSSNKD